MIIDGIEYMTPSEAAEYLKVSRSRIRQLVKAGTLDKLRVMNTDLVTRVSVLTYAAEPQTMGRPRRIKGDNG